MKLDIKTIKEILYRLEDVTALGTQLPLVAFPQMKMHLQKIVDDDALDSVHKEIEDFLTKHDEDFTARDERALKKAFLRMKRKHNDRLEEYRQYYEKIEARKKAIEAIRELFS